jgi:hypothetical protein
MFTAIVFSFVLSVEQLTIPELEKYYWDCDTLFMKEELGADVLSCLAITDQFILKKFNNDRDKFLEYWKQNKHKQWRRRGYVQKQV